MKSNKEKKIIALLSATIILNVLSIIFRIIELRNENDN